MSFHSHRNQPRPRGEAVSVELGLAFITSFVFVRVSKAPENEKAEFGTKQRTELDHYCQKECFGLRQLAGLYNPSILGLNDPDQQTRLFLCYISITEPWSGAAGQLVRNHECRKAQPGKRLCFCPRNKIPKVGIISLHISLISSGKASIFNTINSLVEIISYNSSCYVQGKKKEPLNASFQGRIWVPRSLPAPAVVSLGIFWCSQVKSMITLMQADLAEVWFLYFKCTEVS